MSKKRPLRAIMKGDTSEEESADVVVSEKRIRIIVNGEVANIPKR
jgi:hypothetical protein